MKAMTTLAKSLGLRPGWYGNNCHCRDTVCGDLQCFKGDVQATLDYGFESIKLDACGVEKNMTLFAQLFNETGIPVMLEDCWNGGPYYPQATTTPGKVFCPMNFFRFTADIMATFGSITNNLHLTNHWNENKLTGPGCFPYPDMLEVGVTAVLVPGVRTLNFEEAQTHFGAWCIVSSPLTLSMDLRDAKVMQEVLPIITNKEALNISQTWVGDSGTLIDNSTQMINLTHCSYPNHTCTHPVWSVWRKVLGTNRVAAMAINNREEAAPVTVRLSKVLEACGASPCTIRDVWQHKDLGAFAGNFTVHLKSHASALLIVMTEK
eukprot:m.274035 g.274035  ORF g.274035 m.274035 type:complete len:320 (+) comp66966_c0_seq1:320-1279(+)